MMICQERLSGIRITKVCSVCAGCHSTEQGGISQEPHVSVLCFFEFLYFFQGPRTCSLVLLSYHFILIDNRRVCLLF
jgi:hypothetical protein